MKLQINGQVHEVPDDSTLSALVRLLRMEPPAAILVNGALISRADHARTVVRDGDIVEIVALPAGG